MKNSIKNAVKNKCIDCIYDPLDKGTYLQQVEACSQSDCPLYPFRPLTTKTIDLLREQRVALMTPEQLAQRAKRQANMDKLRKLS